MARYDTRKPTVDLSFKRQPPTPRRVLGLLTILVACLLGAGAAWLVQAGMEYDFTVYATALHHVFFALGIVGMVAGALAEGTGHGASFEFRDVGNTTALIVNALLYAALMIAFLVLSRPRRYKK